MKVNDFVDVLGLIVLAAIVTTIVSSRNTAGQVTALGNSFAKVIASALGAGSINR